MSDVATDPSAPVFEVLDPGLLLTVQDLGRTGFAHLGVPRSGAADTGSLVQANRLAGAEDGAAALEATLLGPRVRVLRDVVVGLAGADLGAVVRPGERALAVGSAATLRRGEVLTCTESGDEARGCRLYISVAGGLDVPVVLGSRSTSLVGAFGGFEGRPLRAGDVLSAGPPIARTGDHPADSLRSWRDPIRILPGPAAGEPGGGTRLDALIGTAWTVSIHSDRRGLRLEAEHAAVGARLAMPGDRPSFGVVPGAIQLTPSGQPLVLMPDGGVTGGYPVIAVVASPDQPALGQLAPGAPIRFVAI